MSEVVINNVHKSFGNVEVLKGVSLAVERGEVLPSSVAQAREKAHCCAASTG